MPIRLGTQTLSALRLGNQVVNRAYLGSQLVYDVAPAFDPATLFASGEIGGVYDYFDTATLFQDASGNTPVTAAGQPVGLIVDKSQGATLGPQLLANGGFDSSANWTISPSVTITGGAAVFSAAAGGNGVNQVVSLPAGFYRISFDVLNWSAGGLIARLRNAGATIFATLVTPNAAGNGTFTGLVYASGSFNQIEIISPGGDGSPSTLHLDNVSLRRLPGNHIWQPTAAQRMTYNLDGSFPFLQSDGVDDHLIGPSINLSSVDKLTVIAGIEKQNNTAGLVYGYGANPLTTAGAAGLYANGFIAGDFSVGTRQSVQWAGRTGNLGTVARRVVTHRVDFAQSTPENASRMRLNKVDQVLTAASGGPMGSGPFGNHQLTIGRRQEGNSFPFFGRYYGSFIVRGAWTDGALLTSAEDWVNEGTGAY